MRSAPIPLAQHWRGKFIKQLENAECVSKCKTRDQFQHHAAPVWHFCDSSNLNWITEERCIRPPWQIFFIFQFTKELYLRCFTNTLLHVSDFNNTLQRLLSCAPDVSLHSKDNVSHLITKAEAAARMLQRMDHGQGQMLRKKVDFTKEHFNLILDMKSRFYCGNLWQIYLQRYLLSVFL